MSDWAGEIHRALWITVFTLVRRRYNSNMNVDAVKLIGWGVIIYALLFLLWSGLATYGLVSGIAPRILGLLVLVAIAYYAGRTLGARSWEEIIPYTIGWVAVAAILDIILSVPYAGWGIFLDYNLWIGYGLLLVAPLFAAQSDPVSALRRPNPARKGDANTAGGEQ